MPKLSDQMGHDDLTEGIVTTLHLHPTGIAYVIDGGGAVITVGNKGHLPIPFDGTITGWVIVADQPGGIVVVVRRTSFASFPATYSIAGTEKPTLVAFQLKRRDDDLTTWTIDVVAGDVLEFVVEEASILTRVTVTLEMEK